MRQHLIGYLLDAVDTDERRTLPSSWSATRVCVGNWTC